MPNFLARVRHFIVRVEPVLCSSAAVSALLALLVAFGVPITSGQQDSIATVVTIVAPLLAGAIARPLVTPAANTATDSRQDTP